MANSPQSTQWLQGIKLTAATFSLAMAAFMMVLDTTIANVAVPTIAGNVGVSVDQGTWVITAFGAANAISMPLTGFLSHRFGEVRLFLFAVIGFTLTSFLCGTATSMESLVIYRILQGAVSGSIAPLSQSLLLRCYSKEKRGTALALWTLTIIVAPIVGPILGGYLTDNYHWSWIFFINVPIGIFVLISCSMLLKGKETTRSRPSIDYIGIGLLVFAAGSLQMLLDLGKQHDWFQSTFIIGLGLVALVSWGVMIIWEYYHDNPVVNVRLFKNRNFSLAVLIMGLGYGIYFGSSVLLPLWLQGVMGYTATWAGLATSPSGILAVVSAPMMAYLTRKVDLRLILTYAFVNFAIVGFWRANFSLDNSFFIIFLPQLVVGAATMPFLVPLQRMIIDGLPSSQIATAVALSSFFRTLSGSFSSSVVTTAWDDRMTFHYARIAENFTVYNQYSMGYLRDVHGNISLMSKIIMRQAYMLSTVDLFWATGVICLCLVPIIWLTKPINIEIE
ncbi:DHA2 family efflux MFS transporter permease subunit [Desulfotalea psychrophila]|uniref:Probable multidrug resistance protein B n=1 Tax=Desulfotalea psychrophila (strain LSv54 / DSM 12343) TaxID=177439 RepID=Q6ARZ1_DESPS|nr:DHA2 family efflux MFS transporter permease subunit [Desulfotalea psychrophila]CAG34884.1 probable multidrug resistance protein B [Desulfotalea psychrophila LSv54]